MWWNIEKGAMMLKFSAGYVNVNPNFVIQNIKENSNNEPVFAVLSNILQRGFPTIPSNLLKDYFGDIQNNSKTSYILNFDNCLWDNVIKGGAEYNPALNFYNEDLRNILGKKNANTFIAECPLTDIVNIKYSKKIGESVDFYSPLYNAVIEIDGIQHITNQEQYVKDDIRNQILNNNKIDIIRISTSELSDIKILKKKLQELIENKNYSKSILENRPLFDNEKNYLLAIRLELLMLNLYKNKYINIEDKNVKVNIFSKDNIKKQIFEICFESYFKWFKNICALQNIVFEPPQLEIELFDDEYSLSLQDGINVVISLEDVYSQATYDNVIYIKNDYFLYEENLISQKKLNERSSFTYKKNYFSVNAEDIEYDLNSEQHSDALKFILNNVSNIYDDFRANQLDIIIECLNNRSVIGVLPTGAGKSLCYQLVSLLIPALTIMIAPLQLLMVDQHDNIKSKLGITNSTYINSTKRENLEIFTASKSLITIISPERFFSEKFTNSLKEKNLNVGFVVIDEAHCLSEWGHDFRTSYLCLSHNLSRFFSATTFLMALTGTASHRVFEDIDCEFQNFKKRRTRAVFAENMRRDNLTIFIQKTDDKYKELIDNISPTLFGINEDKTLIFTKKKKAGFDPTDSACVTLTEKIKIDYGHLMPRDIISYYSGGEELSSDQKEKVLQDLKDGNLLIVLATKAFGMGVDISDIRKTIHYGLPSSFESLYQEFGRAGRDGLPSKCYVYFTPENNAILNKFFRLPPISMSEISLHMRELKELQTNFYFIQSANLDVEIEEKVVKRILQGIKTRNKLFANYVDCKTIVNGPFYEMNDYHLNDICKNPATARTIIERALYRLFLLGEIEMWSVVYSSDINNPQFNNLKVTKLTEEEKLTKLKNHIEKYETSFKFDESNTFENRLKYLINWANENYMQERIQTMKTLYEQCEYFTSSDVFMNYISNYFSNDPVYVRLINKNIRLRDIVDALKAYPEKTKARIARLLESYDKIVPLNYLSGITRLRLNEFDNMDGERRLNLALNEMVNYDERDRDFLFDKTIQYLDAEQKEIFIECWLKYFKDDVYKIYEKHQSKICEYMLIVNFANELLYIGEKINDRL